MRTFKYTYVDAKGNGKESTVEADDKDDAYIILKTMRINPETITETDAEDISFEVIGQKDEKTEAKPRINYVASRAATGKSKDEIEIESVVTVDELRRGEEPKPARKNKTYRPGYEMFALFCAGVALMGWSAWATTRDTADLDWPIAKGYIMHAEMRVIGMFRKSYVPDIAYRYAINGVVYRSKNLFSSEKETTKGEILRMMKIYPVGSKVYLHYNPDDPQQAYIEAVPAGSSHSLSALLGLICFAAATAMFVLAKLNETPQPKAKPKPSPSARKEPEIIVSPWQQKG
ncbi:MAG: DUF3592 domain-containing protein [bacterium]